MSWVIKFKYIGQKGWVNYNEINFAITSTINNRICVLASAGVMFEFRDYLAAASYLATVEDDLAIELGPDWTVEIVELEGWEL